MREWIPDAHEKSKQEPAFGDVFIGRTGRNPNSRMILHGSIGAPPLPTLYSLGPVFVTQSRQHSINIRKLVHFSSRSPSMGYIPTTLCRTRMRSPHIKHEMHLKCLDDPVAICIWGGIISHDWTPFPSRLVAISQVVATATVAFLALVADTQVMLGFKKGRPKVIPRGWAPHHHQPWKWENRAPKN